MTTTGTERPKVPTGDQSAPAPHDACPTCGGDCACPVCDGSGVFEEEEFEGEDCPECNGTGDCCECHGTGVA
jgi:hypothetical protein